MIINRYIIRTIHLGTFTALLALVGLGLIFEFIGELDDLGEGAYDLQQVIKFVALSFPGKVIEFMPLAVLLGSMLGLGALASNSEIVAMQASGLSLRKLVSPVIQAALILAVLNFLLADWVVPDSETYARSVKNLAQEKTSALIVREGLWTKDESRVLHQVQKSIINAEQVETQGYDKLVYKGNLSPQLLEVLMIEPRQMSSGDLRAYLNFLEENRLDDRVERLIFWQKLLAPFTIVIM